MWFRIKSWCLENKYFILLFILATSLLISHISYRTFWNDEMAVLDYFKDNPLEFLINYFKKPDNHPPLYYFLVLLVSKVLPWNEFMVRFISVLSGLGIVFFVYIFSCEVFANKAKALLAVFFTSVSSYFILISQMARYHSLAGLFSLMTIYFFYQLVIKGYSKSSWFWYLISLICVGYTDYPHFFYVAVAINLVYLYTLVKRRPILSPLEWFFGHLVVAVILSPLVFMVYHRVVIQGDGGWNNLNLLANSWMNIFLAIFFHIYSFFFGENIFPWDYVFWVGVVVLTSILVGFIKGFQKKLWTNSQLFCVFFSVIFIVLNTLFMNVADPRYNFIVYPKFGFVAYPLSIIAFVLCLDKLAYKTKVVMFSLWLLVGVCGLFNFYRATNYLNPSYFRTFVMFEYVRDNSRAGDYFAIGPHAGQGFYEFYKEQYFYGLRSIEWNDIPVAPKKTRIWFFATSAEGNEATVNSEMVVPPGYKILDRLDGVPLDPTFKKFKERILHRPSYSYKYSIFLIEKI
jgi:uncharacterized membrane protein